ncbi:uncharacterized protein LOC125821097 [Solanum verrucosum]|uniref:uncharacterized protein LOC125821097 n=1 Tax=Solanum verrucosum TaxID=315347 RepID=UPI0020D02FBF|nr:uncharacterized protein LOC125821097 [Solanum verrucosum]
MDPTINTVALSEMIPTTSVAANPSPSVETESSMEVIASLEQQIGELNFLTFAPPKAPTVTHHAPPVYTYVTVPPVTKAREFHRQDVNHYVEIENDAKSIDVEMMNKKIKSLEDAMRGLHGFYSRQSVRYEELCTFPEVELPLGYKIPKFEKFSGSGNPFFHLKIYCEKLIGAGNNEGIRIKLFNQSLTGKALISITKLKPKSTECFREYAIRWREEAARVHPPMEESEMITYFIQA